MVFLQPPQHVAPHALKGVLPSSPGARRLHPGLPIGLLLLLTPSIRRPGQLARTFTLNVDTLYTIAESRGWEHGRHLHQIASRLRAEVGDRDIYRLFNTASTLHENFYECQGQSKNRDGKLTLTSLAEILNAQSLEANHNGLSRLLLLWLQAPHHHQTTSILY